MRRFHGRGGRCAPWTAPPLLGAAALAALLSAVLPADASTLLPPPRGHTLGFDRVTPRELALALPGVKIGAPAGIAVVRLASTNDPKSSKDDDEVTVIAVDSETGYLLANGRGLKAIVWGRDPGSVGPLVRPTDVAIDTAGRVAVTDTGNRRVVLLRHDGTALRPLRAFDGFGDPRGVTADGRGGFYVCDRTADRVVRLDAENGRRDSFGLEVSFDRPTAIAMVAQDDRLAKGKMRRVAVVDRDGARLRLFTIEGNLVASRDASQVGAPGASFDDVDLDYFGNVFAVDRAGHRVHKLRDDLFPLDTFGARGAGPGQFQTPRGLAIHRPLGQVFITEEKGGRYLWIGTDVRDLRAKPNGENVEFSYRLTEESVATMRILDSAGREVATLYENDRQSAGTTLGTWDGSSRNGARVAAGEYTAEIRARATYSSKSYDEARATVRFRWGAGS